MISRALLLFFLILMLFILNAFLNQIPQKNVPESINPKYGVSYSFEQATWYGLDAKEAYGQLLEFAHFDWVRLPFFWDHMVGKGGELEVSDLEFAIREAEKKNIGVIVALGLKTPYYPEYHLPNYITSQIKFGEKIDINHKVAQPLLELNKKLVEKLSVHNNIVAWQVENEPYLANVNNWKIDDSLIRAEVEIVRSSDFRKRPVILNHVGPAVFDKRYRNLLKILEPGDILGVNAYFKTQGIYLFSFKVLNNQINVNWPKFLIWPVQSWFFFSPNYQVLGREAARNGVKLWVLEVQAEPYIRNLEDAQRLDFEFEPQDIPKVNNYLRSHRVDSIGFWGSQFWLYKQKNGDNSWLNTVKEVID